MNLNQIINQKVQTAFEKAGYPDAQLLVRLSDRPDISDYQSNGALPLAKQLKTNPRVVAEAIVSHVHLCRGDLPADDLAENTVHMKPPFL